MNIFKYYTNYHKIFNGKRLQTVDFITFVDALWRLRTEYDPNSNTEDCYEKCNNQQLLCKRKLPRKKQFGYKQFLIVLYFLKDFESRSKININSKFDKICP